MSKTMSKTIVCADDSATMQKVAEITFAATEYRCVGATNVDDALKLAGGEKPALILADAIIPGKDGYDLCRAVKSDPDLADVPVLLMCGNSQGYDSARGTEAGADGHVIKPWDTQVMLDKVAEVLSRAAQEGVAKLGAGVAAPSGPATAAVPGGPGASITPVPTPTPTMPPPARAATPPPVPPVRPGTPPPAGPGAVKTTLPVTSPLAQRSATIMGMPSFPLPPGNEPPSFTPVTAPSSAPAASAPATTAAAVSARPADGGAASGMPRPPMIKGTPQRRLRLVPITEVAADVAKEHGLDPTGPEMQAIVKLSKEVVERIVWEVVPELAEAIIRQNLDKLTARAR